MRARTAHLCKLLTDRGISDAGGTRSKLIRLWRDRADAEQQILAVFAAVERDVLANPRKFVNPTGHCINILLRLGWDGGSFIDEASTDVFAKAVREAKARQAAPAPTRRSGRAAARPQVHYSDEQRAAAEARARQARTDDHDAEARSQALARAQRALAAAQTPEQRDYWTAYVARMEGQRVSISAEIPEKP